MHVYGIRSFIDFIHSSIHSFIIHPFIHSFSADSVPDTHDSNQNQHEASEGGAGIQGEGPSVMCPGPRAHSRKSRVEPRRPGPRPSLSITG